MNNNNNIDMIKLLKQLQRTLNYGPSDSAWEEMSDTVDHHLHYFEDLLSFIEESSGKNKTSEHDPNGLNPSDLGAKLDAGKPDAGLLKQFGLALLEVAKVSTYGSQKYSRGGWQHVDDGINRYDAAMMRHWLKSNSEEIDEDSGLKHKAQVAWCALASLELELREGTDE